MLRSIRTCFCLLMLLTLAGTGRGYGQLKTIKTFPVRTFYEDNGLISNRIFTATQSSSGELWFGTAKGISTFDGIRWHHISGSESFPFSYRSMLVALPGDSMLQIGFNPKGQAALRLYHQAGVKDLTIFPSTLFAVENRSFNAAVSQANGKLQLALLSEEFLLLQEGLNSRWQKVKIPASIREERVTKLIFYQKTLHLLTTGGLYSYQPERKKFQQLWPSMLNNKVIVSATTSPDGEQLYLLGNNWLARCSNNRLRMLLTDFIDEEPFSLASSYNILATKSGLLIFQIDNSLFLLNPGSGFLEPFRLTNSFSTAIPTAIHEDSEGNIWFSTLRGVALLNSLRFANMDKVVGLPDSEISTIFQIDSGTVLLGSNLGVNVLKDYRWKQKAQGDVYHNNSSYRIMDATRLNEQQLAIAGNQQGLGILDETNDYKVSWHALPDKMLATAVSVLQDKLLIGTEQGVVLQFEKGQFREFLRLPNAHYIRQLRSDSTGNLLLLTPKGLLRIKGSSSELLRSGNHQGNDVYSLLEWKGRSLLGTGNGVYELKQDKLISLEALIPVNRPVYSLLTDKKGRLWMGTDKGVFMYEHERLINFNRYNGLAGQEVNRNALVEMKDGRIWIGTDRGLSIYDPHYDDPQRTIVPRLRLKEVRANDQPLNAKENLALSADQNTLEFIFQPLSFYQPEGLEYRYRLVGLENSWTYSNNYLQNSARFTSLPPGQYHFVVQARLEGGDWSPEVVSQPLVIASPFYAQWWFIGSGILLIGFLGYTTRSLTQHKSNEKRLKAAIDDKKSEVAQSEAKFQAIWESMDTSVVVCDRSGLIYMSNPSFCRFFNFTTEALEGREISSVLEHNRFSKAFIESWYENPSVLRFEIELKVGGLANYLLVTFSYLNKLNAKDPMLVIGLKNVSHQKEAEMKNLRLNELLVRQNRDLVKKELELASFNRELLKRQKELQEAMQVLEERNFELDQFVYKTSHDLRAPIASSIGLLNIMKMEGASPAWPRYVDMIMRSLQKQDSFIKAMLNFSKTARASEKPEYIDFEQLIENCLFDLQYLAGFESIEKQLTVKDRCNNFFSDKMKINIILSNILSNAIKYRDSGKASFLEVTVDVNVEHAIINIRDNGIGVNKAYINNIFDMFYRATERSDGSGLGLYIVKQTIERLGGKVEVTSELGVGSCFNISIPNMISALEEAPPKLAPQAQKQ